MHKINKYIKETRNNVLRIGKIVYLLCYFSFPALGFSETLEENHHTIATSSLFANSYNSNPFRFKSQIYRLVSFPFIHISIQIDKMRSFIWSKTTPTNNSAFFRIRKIAFANSIRIITSKRYREIKFIDKNESNEKKYLGFAILSEDGSLDINYKIKERDQNGVHRYLTRFTGDDVLEYIFDFFKDAKIKRILCIFERSNLDAFNLAFAEDPSDKVRAAKNTHFGNFLINNKEWIITQDDITTYGDPGGMRASMFSPGKANFYQVDFVFHPPNRSKYYSYKITSPGLFNFPGPVHFERVFSTSA